MSNWAIEAEQLIKRFPRRATPGVASVADNGQEAQSAAPVEPSSRWPFGKKRDPAVWFTAVDGVDLTIQPGEVFGLLGPNGAGKTTTIRMLCTLLEPTSGTARVNGFDIVKQSSQVRQSLGTMLAASQTHAAEPARPDPNRPAKADVMVVAAYGLILPQAVLDNMVARYAMAREAGYSGSRVCGEMTWALRGIPGSDRLLEYEIGINLVHDAFPHVGMCQYDARLFDGATLFKVLQVHPYMIAHGQIVWNPCYASPKAPPAPAEVKLDWPPAKR